MKTEYMSKSITDIMKKLSSNKALVQLLVNNVDNPYSVNIDLNKLDIMGTSSDAKISPVPFNPNANQEDSSFIRIYYNDGELDETEVITESNIFIDIVVAKNLWLINDSRSSLIRPYEIMGRVIDLVGRRSVGTGVKVRFRAYNHLHVNEKFDAIRLYAEYFNVKA